MNNEIINQKLGTCPSVSNGDIVETITPFDSSMNAPHIVGSLYASCINADSNQLCIGTMMTAPKLSIGNPLYDGTSAFTATRAENSYGVKILATNEMTRNTPESVFAVRMDTHYSNSAKRIAVNGIIPNSHEISAFNIGYKNADGFITGTRTDHCNTLTVNSSVNALELTAGSATRYNTETIFTDRTIAGYNNDGNTLRVNETSATIGITAGIANRYDRMNLITVAGERHNSICASMFSVNGIIQNTLESPSVKAIGHDGRAIAFLSATNSNSYGENLFPIGGTRCSKLIHETAGHAGAILAAEYGSNYSYRSPAYKIAGINSIDALEQDLSDSSFLNRSSISKIFSEIKDAIASNYSGLIKSTFNSNYSFESTTLNVTLNFNFLVNSTIEGDANIIGDRNSLSITINRK